MKYFNKLILLLVFGCIGSVSADQELSCLDSSSKPHFDLERKRNLYLKTYGSKHYKVLDKEQKLALCVEVYSANFFDLAEKLCFGDYHKELSINDQVALRHLQGFILIHQLKFSSAIENSNAILESVRIQRLRVKKDSVNYWKLDYFKFHALLYKMISMSFMNNKRKELENLKIKIEDLLSGVDFDSCVYVLYLGNALTIFPDQANRLITKYSKLSTTTDCSLKIQRVINDFLRYKQYTDNKISSEELFMELENEVVRLEEECDLINLAASLIELSHLKWGTASEDSAKYLKKIEQIARITGDKSIWGRAYWIRAINEATKGQIDSAIFFFDSACTQITENAMVNYSEAFGGVPVLVGQSKKILDAAYSKSLCAHEAAR